VSCPTVSDAFLAPDVVDEIWRALRARTATSDAVRAHLSDLGVAEPERVLEGEYATLSLADLDIFPRVNLADDPQAPTCSRDLPLRQWLKLRLRERGDAVVFPLRSLARDVVVNLYIRYLRDGRRDFLRGAGLADADTPIVLGAARGDDVAVVGGLEPWLAAVGRGEAQTIATPLVETREDVVTFLAR
jgi:hypothetical protein